MELSGKLERKLEMSGGRVIIVFCEALGLKSLYHEVQISLRGVEYSRALTTYLLPPIRAWGKLFEKVQTMRRT